MRPMIVFLVCLWSFSNAFAQSLELENLQAYSSYVTTGSDNGSVVVLRNTSRDLDYDTTDDLNLGAINFRHLAADTPGQIAYSKYSNPGEFFELRGHKLDFRVGGEQVMRLVSQSFGGATYSQYLEMSSGATCTAGGVWEDASSAELKHLGGVLNGDEIIDKVRKLPLYHWAYKSQPDEKHIGPTAEDFSALFEVGSSNKRVAALDLGGISLVAVQALIEEVEVLKIQVSQLTAQLVALRKPQDLKVTED